MRVYVNWVIFIVKIMCKNQAMKFILSLNKKVTQPMTNLTKLASLSNFFRRSLVIIGWWNFQSPA